MKHPYVKKWAKDPTKFLCIIFAVFLVTIIGARLAVAEDPGVIPSQAEWDTSGHADSTAEAFAHWDEDDPPEVSTRCAKCHSTLGHQDFLGVDGTAAGSVENPVAVGPGVTNNITCVACHNDASAVMDSVTFPSGIEVTGLGSEARCMQCHQGRASKYTVDDAITDAAVPDDDTVSDDLSFKNIHYLAAGATQYGGVTKGGYEYEGKMYDTKFAHVKGLDTCSSCHNPHSLEVKVGLCGECHEGVTTAADLPDIRFVGSAPDYDGDSNVSEGIAYEIEGLQGILYSAMQDYATNVAGMGIVYDSHSYPYFFVDPNGNGQVDDGEASYGNWTGSLLKAAYNYQFSLKDPGGYAHNGKYVIQLIYDSIEDMDTALVAGLSRDDSGHFSGSGEPFRHWDEDESVSSSCGKCHSATGLPQLVEHGVVTSQPQANGLLCSTCHDSIPGYSVHSIDEVEFPSGATVSFGDGHQDNLCINCHQGRQSTVSVNDYLTGKGATENDTVYGSLSFRNVHYYAAGATVFGSEAKGAYEYKGKAYNGRLMHLVSMNSCTECHDKHTLKPKEALCAGCHDDSSGYQNIRDRDEPTVDYDGDGDSNEGIGEEIQTLRDALYSAMQSYATSAGTGIVYDSHTYPYFFVDTNGNGQPDEGEVERSNSYNVWTPRLLRAAYNYQFVLKDPGGFAHNGRYIIQILYDSIEDLGQDMTSMARPELEYSSPECGDVTFPYPVGDFTEDCIVNLDDFFVFSSYWLENNNP